VLPASDAGATSNAVASMLVLAASKWQRSRVEVGGGCWWYQHQLLVVPASAAGATCDATALQHQMLATQSLRSLRRLRCFGSASIFCFALLRLVLPMLVVGW